MTLNTPNIGIEVGKDNDDRWTITQVDNLSWANMEEIEIGDIIISVDHESPERFPSVRHYMVIEGAQKLELFREGETRTYTVSLQAIPNAFTYEILLPSVLLLLFIPISIFLYIKKPNDKSARYLFLFFHAVGLAYLGNAASGRTDFLSMIMVRSAFLCVPIFFLQFLYSFFYKNGIRGFSRYWTAFCYSIAGILILLDVFCRIQNRAFFYQIVKSMHTYFFAITLLFIITLLILRYINYRKQSQKALLKYMAFGMGAAFFPYICLNVLPSLLFNIEVISTPLAGIFLLFLPVVFIYLVIVQKLLDIDFLISRLFFLSALAFLPSVLFIILLFQFQINFSIVQWIRLGLFIYVGSILLFYLKEEMDSRLYSRLWGRRYNFQESLTQFSINLAKIMNISELENAVIKEIKQSLTIKKVTILEWHKKDNIVTFKSGDTDFPGILIRKCLINHSEFSGTGSILDTYHGVCVHLKQEPEYSYILWLGDKANRVKLNLSEKSYIKTLAVYVAILYENLTLIQGLSKDLVQKINPEHSAPPWVLRLLFQLSENERRRLALDLHDSVLQEQIALYRNLETIYSETSAPARLNKSLYEAKERLLDIIYKIRETCNELRPPFIKEKGIVDTLQPLFKQTQLRANYTIHFNAKDFDASLNYDQLLAIYRIVQELLSNATKHSGASNVVIKLSNDLNTVSLIYKDDGVGLGQKAFQSSFVHMGLSGIKERISSLEGEITIDPEQREGLYIVINLPIDVKIF